MITRNSGNRSRAAPVCVDTELAWEADGVKGEWGQR